MRLRYCVGISLLLHAVVLFPFLLVAPAVKKAAVREETLNLELFSMVADRPEKEEEPPAGDPDIPFSPVEPAPQPAPAQVEPETATEEPPENRETASIIDPSPEIPMEELPVSVFESPVVVPIPAITPNVPSPTVDNTVGMGGNAGISASAPTTGGYGESRRSGAGDNRGGGRTGTGGKGTTNPLDLYISGVANRLQANLVYPEKMRRGGIEAVTSIAFTVTESGQIKRGTLEVRKSSGYREMDDNALRAARESTPFEKLPKEMTLVIAVVFEIQRSNQ